MNIPKNWDTTQAFDGSYEQMTPGGHICRITGARVETNSYGSEQLVLALDVQEGSKYDCHHDVCAVKDNVYRCVTLSDPSLNFSKFFLVLVELYCLLVL